MKADHDLRDFQNVTRLFPLAGVVLFPHSVLPLHIFEPRYRQMTEDALASDRLITIIQPDLCTGLSCGDRPPLEPVGCLGKILTCHRLPDGRFNFLLLGLRRVRLLREVASETLYRLAEVEVLQDEPPDGPEEARRAELIRLFRIICQCQEANDPDLTSLLEKDLALGVLTDIVAHALSLPAVVKQALLEDRSPTSRAERLADILRQVVERQAAPPRSARPYPPPFSPN